MSLPCAAMMRLVVRILQVNSSSGFGGAETHVAQLVRGLAARGHRVHVASPSYGSLVKDVLDSGGRHHPIDVFSSPPGPCDFAGLYQVVRRVAPDLIHVHGMQAGLLLRTALLPDIAAKGAHRGDGGSPAKCPGHGGRPGIVYTVHGAHFAFYPPYIQWIYAAAERILQRITDETIFVCRHDMEQTQSAGAIPPRRGVVIHNGLDAERIERSHDTPETLSALRREVREELELPEDSFLFLAMGRLIRPKDHHTMLRAVARARRELRARNAFLAIAGDGPERETLHDLADGLHLTAGAGAPGEDHPQDGPLDRPLVRFLGFREDISRLLAGTDALVLSSLWEGLPYILLEAMAAQLPVIATDTGGVPECVGHERSGLLVPPEDPSALADALLRLLQEPGLADRLARTGRRDVGRQFGVEQMLDHTENVYRRVMGGSRLHGNARSAQRSMIRER